MRLSVEETLRNLKQVEEKYKIRFTPTGEVNISEMARDCIDTIEALQQENEQLRAKLGDWKYEVQCHMDEVTARDKENEQLRAQAAAMREALRKAREEAQNALDNYELVGEHEYDISEHLQIALAAIDKAIEKKEVE